MGQHPGGVTLKTNSPYMKIVGQDYGTITISTSTADILCLAIDYVVSDVSNVSNAPPAAAIEQ